MPLSVETVCRTWLPVLAQSLQVQVLRHLAKANVDVVVEGKASWDCVVKCDAFAGWSWKSRGPVNLLDIERFQCLSQVTAIIFVLQFYVARHDFDPDFRDGIKTSALW